MSLHCADFEDRSSFSDFIRLLQTSTGGNITLAEECAPQICRSLWGVGNPDISGIGATAGYVMDSILGLVLTAMCLHSSKSRKWWPMNRPQLLLSMLEAYHEAALFFALSIQVACSVVLTRVTYGLDADGMGDLTVRTTWTVASLCMLPLLYRTFLLDEERCESSYAVRPRSRASARASFVFPLFSVCWAAFLYIFLNRMTSTFHQSQIGSGPGCVISRDDWTEVEALCKVDDWDSTPYATGLAINAFGVVAALLIVLLGLLRLVYEILKAWNIDVITRRKQAFEPFQSYARLSLWVVVPVLAIGLLWTFFALQASSKALAQAIGESDDDGEWSFGQVMSVIVFAPVLVEFLSGIVNRETVESSHL